MLLSVAAVVAGLALLVWSADRFVLGASGLARAAGLSPLVIGMVVVGFGTSSPELAVSTMASIEGNSGIALGNVVGSNIANVALILGICALIRPLDVQSGILRRELPMALAASVALLLMVLDGALTRIDGLLLASGLIAFLVWSVRAARRGTADPLASEMAVEVPPAISTGRALLWIALGLLMLVASSQLLIWGAVNLARMMGVSDLVIGLTIVAIGTSLPELAASVAGVLKNEHDIAIGNILGSNLFNILAILIAPALIVPGAIPDHMLLWRDIPIMIATMLLLFASASGLRGHPLKVERVDGALLLGVYIAYTLILLASAASG
ncbi:calcium/sodium antiporter [Sinimarinibacterium sp. CAU 1509]|uniref:calcium/sodium antiporter n=1 Tax=Sinimarinibacterium sp. CAU 1509 TaxID=2562283 RepID=UPI0010AB98D1|nr:calcium/sodium antiporter [Sinimarinibacterium sp. CAU 1509]TJY65142.1 calcium/sodium antiporter [Sinimarinibacterium sp. CAU 1509]